MTMPMKHCFAVMRRFSLISSPLSVKQFPANYIHYSTSLGCREKYDIQALKDEYYSDNMKIPSVSPINITEYEEQLDLVSPAVTPTYTFSKHVNNSTTLKELVKLGVNLSRIEKDNRDMILPILKMEFHKDVKPYLELMLNSDIPASNLGFILTKAPEILVQDIQDLQVRFNFLINEGFSKRDIKTIISKNPLWICKMTHEIKDRIKYLEKQYHLSNIEVRKVIVKMPKLLTYNKWNLKFTSFAFEEEMGYEKPEIREILLKCPKLWIISRKVLLERFDYIHNQLRVSHEQIKSHPSVLTSRISKIKERHAFLKLIGKDQFDPSKPNFVPVHEMICNIDATFCRDIAHVSIDIYNNFLKTL